MSKLAIIVASTRPARKGIGVARWFYEFAQSHSDFELDFVDLAEVNLPVYNESAHPRLKQYEHEYTRAWSARIEAADAFVFVTPEYNYSTPPALVNALDYLYQEWNYKAAAFVSYGGQSGGLRAVQVTKQLLTTLKVVPIVEALALPFFNQYLNESGEFNATESHQKSAQELLKELGRWTEALKTLR